ncbi:hypothetical protein [Vibrio diabolicus]|uniref:hypothetical protein n=1 Tax=Vibrio diabolicus TaxID=50719 RepID=UPI003750C375
MSEVDLANPAASTGGGFKRVKRMISHVHGTVDNNAEETYGSSDGTHDLEFYAVESPFIVSSLGAYSGGKIEWIEIDGVRVLSTPLYIDSSGTSGTILAYKDIMFPFHRVFATAVIEKSLKMRISGKAFRFAFTDVEV